MHSPSANKLKAHLFLVMRMSRMDIRKRYLGTLLGGFWSILFPLVTIGLIYVVMTYGLKVTVAPGAVPYAHWLITGMLAWFLVSEALSTGVGAVVDNSHLVTKMRFPLLLLVPVKVIAAVPVHILLVSVFMVVMAVQGIGSFAYWIQVPYYFLSAVVLALGINYLSSAAQVFTRDVGNIMGVLLQVFFWATPIFWNPDFIADSKFRFLLYSPFTYIVTGYRDSLLDAIPFWQRPLETVIFWVITLSILCLGIALFQRLRSHFADVL